MTPKKKLKLVLICSLFLISAGGLMLHLKIHPVGAAGHNAVPFFSGLASLALVTALLLTRGAVIYGHILNGMTVILGTITMAHFSWVHMPRPATLRSLLLMTLFADIVLLWGKFGLGKAVFDLETADLAGGTQSKTGVWRVPNAGWWAVHLAGMALVYVLGHVLWR